MQTLKKKSQSGYVNISHKRFQEWENYQGSVYQEFAILNMSRSAELCCHMEEAHGGKKQLERKEVGKPEQKSSKTVADPNKSPNNWIWPTFTERSTQPRKNTDSLQQNTPARSSRIHILGPFTKTDHGAGHKVNFNQF